jgi:hypothetical protein
MSTAALAFSPCFGRDFVFKPMVIELNERFYLNKITKLPNLCKKPDLLLWVDFRISEMDADIQVACS